MIPHYEVGSPQHQPSTGPLAGDSTIPNELSLKISEEILYIVYVSTLIAEEQIDPSELVGRTRKPGKLCQSENRERGLDASVGDRLGNLPCKTMQFDERRLQWRAMLSLKSTRLICVPRPVVLVDDS